MLGVPGGVTGLATSRLLSVRGKLRAAIEPLLPRDLPPTRSPPTRSGDSSGHGSATRCTSGSSTRSSAASTPPTPTASAWRWCRSSPSWPMGRAACCSPPDRCASGGRRRPGRSSTPRSSGMQSLATATPGRRRGRRRDRADRIAGVERRAPTVRGGGSTASSPTRSCWRPRRRAPLRSSPARHPACPTGWPRWSTPAVVIVTIAVRRLAGAAARPQRLPRPEAGAATGDGGLVRLAEVGALAAATARSCACRWAATASTCSTGATTSSSTPPSPRSAATSASTSNRPRRAVSRWPAAFPQYRPGHRDWLDAVAAATRRGAVPHRRQLPGHRCPRLYRRRRGDRRGRPSQFAASADDRVITRRTLMSSDADLPSQVLSPPCVRSRKLPSAFVAAGLIAAVAASAAAGDDPHRPRRTTLRTAPHCRRPTREAPGVTPIESTMPPLPFPEPVPPDNATGAADVSRPDPDPGDRASTPRSSRASGSPRSTTAPATGPARRCRASSATSSSPDTGRATTPTSATSTSSQPGDQVIFDLDDPTGSPNRDGSRPGRRTPVPGTTRSPSSRSSTPRRCGSRARLPPRGHAVRLPPAGLGLRAHRRSPRPRDARRRDGRPAAAVDVHVDRPGRLTTARPSPSRGDGIASPSVRARTLACGRAARRVRCRRGAGGRCRSPASRCSTSRSASMPTRSHAVPAAGSCSGSGGWRPARRGCGSSPRPATSSPASSSPGSTAPRRSPLRPVGGGSSGDPLAHTLVEALRFSFPFGGVPLASLGIAQAAGPVGRIARVGGVDPDHVGRPPGRLRRSARSSRSRGGRRPASPAPALAGVLAILALSLVAPTGHAARASSSTSSPCRAVASRAPSATTCRATS